VLPFITLELVAKWLIFRKFDYRVMFGR